MLINQMIMSNPQLARAMEYVRNNGGNPQTAFYNLAKEMGIDPQAVLNELNQ